MESGCMMDNGNPCGTCRATTPTPKPKTIIERIQTAISEYCGWTAAKVDVRPDPMVSNVWAVKATFNMGRGQKSEGTFLVTGCGLARPDGLDVEEVEFTSWPPTARI